MNKKQTIVLVLILVLILSFIILFAGNCLTKEKVSVLKEFNSAGQLIGTNEYVIRNEDTILDGKFVRYNEMGSKIAEGRFVDDDIYGKCTYYFDNGNIESSYFKRTSKINLEALWNYTNERIKKYAFYDDAGDLAFLITYKENGTVDSYNGAPVIEIYQRDIKEKQSLKIGDRLKYSYIVANIPNAKRSFKIENISVDNSKVKRTLRYIPPTQIDVEEVLTKKGKNTIRSIVRYEFNDKVTPVFIDTISFDVDVH